MMGISIKNISKSFERPSGELEVLSDVSIEVDKNEFVSILGPSGCGKSTLLKIAAGLIKPDKGIIKCLKNLSYLQQNGPLMPWRNVLDNVLLPIEIRTGSKPKYNDEMKQIINEFGLAGFEDAMPDEISGGMAKRAAMLRTYLENKDILLLDEPFSSLDAITRKSMGKWLLEIWTKHKKSVLFVTHDIEEALLLSDRIYIMSHQPSTVEKTIIPVFGRPRISEIVYSREFINQRREIEEILI